MFKRHAAFLVALVLILGATGAVASTVDGLGPTLAQFLGLQERVNDLEDRVSALEGNGRDDADDGSDLDDQDHGDGHDDGDDQDHGDGQDHDHDEGDEGDEQGDSTDGHDGHDEEGGSDGDTVVSDVVLSGDYPEGITVEKGQTARVEGLVTTPKNVVVHGTLVMRPGSHLRFRDVDMTKYVGAKDQAHQPVVDSDVGLWVTEHGVLDIAGSPKQGWNRTGSHPTWSSSDEYWISPTDPGDFDPRPWSLGDDVPQFDPRVPAAEVINVTRDVVIEGPAHIHVHSHKPQRIEYVQLRSMGVSNKAHEGPVLGRYALHIHHGKDGTRGTLIRGVAAINSKGRVFVPHQSHGITMRENVSVNSYAEALWWDKGDKTEDLLVDRLAATGVHMPREVAGTSRNIPVVALKSNEGATISNSAVSAARGRSRALGFHWNTSRAHRLEHRAQWNFHDNVTHNNEGYGLRFWFNDRWAHEVVDSFIYNNGSGGINNGAYGNANRYTNVLLLNNGDSGITHHSSSREQTEDGGPSRYTGVKVEGSGPALEIGRLRGTPANRQEFVGCELNGSPKVLIDSSDKTENPFIALFRDCGDLTPDDIVFGGSRISSALDGSSIIIEHPNGRAWEITVENGRKVVTNR